MVAGVVVRVLVAFAVTEPLGARIVGVTQMFRDRKRRLLADLFARVGDSHVTRVALGSARDVYRRLRQWYLRLGHADKLAHLQRRVRDQERLRVGVAHVFGRADDDSSGDEARFLAGLEHLGEPVDGGVGIGATHALDEGGDGVVMVVAGAVVYDGFALDRFLRYLKGDMYNVVAVGFGRHRGDLECVQRAARVAVGVVRPMAARVVVEPDLHCTQPALFVGERAVE